MRVAAVQMRSDAGRVAENLARAGPFVAEAAGQGARLVLLPELLPTGYRMTDDIWQAAEPPDGSTAQWLHRMAAAHGVLIGTSFLEADGADFFNTFVLAGPEGEALRRRKAWPASVEAWFYRGGGGSRVADTALGRIGVSICYEQMLAAVLRELHAGRPDLVLMPHSAPRLKPERGFSARDAAAYMRLIREAPVFMVRALGVPVVLANKVGPWRTPLPGPFPAADSDFPGGSCIVGADGTVLARLDESEEGIAVAEVTPDPDRPLAPLPPMPGRWSRPLPWFTRVWRMAEMAGGLRYRLSRRRNAAAKAVC